MSFFFLEEILRGHDAPLVMPCLFFSQPLIIFPFRSEPGVENWLSWISWSLSLFLSLALLYGPPFLLYFCNFLFCFILHYSFRRLFSLYLLIPVLTIMKATTTGGMAFSPSPPPAHFLPKCSCVWIKKEKGNKNEEEDKLTIMDKYMQYVYISTQ